MEEIMKAYVVKARDLEGNGGLMADLVIIMMRKGSGVNVDLTSIQLRRKVNVALGIPVEGVAGTARRRRSEPAERRRSGTAGRRRTGIMVGRREEERKSE